MLFNSYYFIFLFLPVTLLVFFKIGGLGHYRVAISWLVAASLFFYGWWNPAYLGLIIGSILFNFSAGIVLASESSLVILNKKKLLVLSISINLAILGYYKYTNFFIENINTIAGADIYVAPIILPLALSFFTFQQIAYLVDTYRGETKEYNFLQYCLFVTFFPQLIAGPIVHHKEMLPQFTRDIIYRFDFKNVSIGLTIFFIGLFKKVVLADGIAQYANPVFAAADTGVSVAFVEAWSGAMAYTFQLYFDFSGYADMAIGIARLFGIRLPLNFNSPYKANSIIDFWRRWHMTLSRFLRDYVYFALGGSHRGVVRRYSNLMATMLLGGLWHGAGWTFIIWGALHGCYLVVNHLWRSFYSGLGLNADNTCYKSFSRIITFLAVVVSWVFFRAESLDAALIILSGMCGLNGVVLSPTWLQVLGPVGQLLLDNGAQVGLGRVGLDKNAILWSVALLFVVWCFPNTQQVMARYKPAFEIYKGEIMAVQCKYLLWKPSLSWVLIIAFTAILSLFSMMKVSEFLYFQF
ncbi:Probable poly(beta-D-mannuronate) O-acetylase [hydrothermal vent metagenome]|uniref:Probable poly(Beta-D-mannuronate) O-acetylase n=1 Tax=hydrothermal vent metagenome TaxID=652676 RepID=A0A3B0WSH0_9ZZZZ